MIPHAIKWAKQKENWSETKVCQRCFIQYIELENIGRWQCSCHKGHKIEVNKGKHGILTSGGWIKTGDFRWSCCPNVIWSTNHVNGCTPCDHSNTKIQFTDQDVMSKICVSWLRELETRPEAIVTPGQDSEYVVIKRAQ